MTTILRFENVSRSLLAMLCIGGGLVACTTQESGSGGAGGSTPPTGTGGSTGAPVTGLGTLCPLPSADITNFAYTASDSGVTDQPRFGGGSGTLQGGGSYYPSSGATAIKSNITQGNWHFSGTVSDYSGFGLYFDLCDRVDASAFKGVTFTVSGNIPSITFGVGTVDDTPTGTWMLSPGGKTTAKATDSGRCTPTSGNQYYHPGCVDPIASVPVTAAPVAQSVTWALLTGGAPVASPKPNEITSIYWYFPWQDKGTPYDLDFTIDDLKFIP